MQEVATEGQSRFANRESVTRWLQRGWPALVLATMVLMVFWPVLFSHYTLYPADNLHELFLPFATHRSGIQVQTTAHIDYVDYYYPIRAYLWASLREGNLPLWNPYVRGGFPQLASQGSLVTLDPFNLLFLMFDLPQALAWRSALQVLFCGLFMYLYLRGLGLHRFAAWAGAVGLAFNSMFWANTFDWSLGSVVWWPLVLWLLHRALERQRLACALVAGLVFGVGLLASPLQPAVFFAFVVVVLPGLRYLLVDRGSLSFKAFATPAILTVVIGLMIASVQLLPAAELVLVSDRHGNELRSPLQATLTIPAFITFIFPNLAGRFKETMRITSLWDGGSHFQGYAGIMLFAFAALTVFAVRDRIKRAYLLAAIFVLISIFTPIRAYLYDRFLIVYIFCLCVLAAVGADRLLRGSLDRERARRMVMGLVAVFGLVLVGLITVNLVHSLWPKAIDNLAQQRISRKLAEGHPYGYNVPLYQQKLDNLWANYSLFSPTMYLPLALGFAGLGLLYGLLRDKLNTTRFRIAAVVLISIDLASATLFQNAFVDLQRNPLFPPHPLIEQIRSDRSLFRVGSMRRARDQEPPILNGMMWTAYQLQSPTGNDSLDFLGINHIGFTQDAWTEVTSAVEPDILDLLNIKYLFVNQKHDLPEPRFRLVAAGDGLHVYENTTVMPRAFFVTESVVQLDRKRATKLLHDPAFDWRRSVILEEMPQMPVSNVRDGESVVRVSAYQAQEVTVEVDTTSPGFLVLSDNYYRGWKATVDGKAARILRVNVVMRAVQLEPGRHEVRFYFDPLSFRLGLALSLGGGLSTLLALVFIAGRLGRRYWQ